MHKRVETFLDDLIERYGALDACREAIAAAFEMMRACYARQRKLLVCGNGGSAADAEHVVGELMKEFLLKRRMPADEARRLIESVPKVGNDLAAGLQRALPAISLVSQSALLTAFANDVNTDMAFAQQVYGYGKPGDVLLAISTSGNSDNICNAAYVAKAVGVESVALTGGDGGRLRAICDVSICVPQQQTYRIQELHQPVYHALCAMLEEEFFGEHEDGRAPGR
jgi:D-sedoheptulose 7-phosphate isomerase